MTFSLYSIANSGDYIHGELGKYQDRYTPGVKPFFTDTGIGKAIHMNRSRYIMMNVSYVGGCSQHYFAFKTLDANKEDKYLKLELLHETNDTCEGGRAEDIYLEIPKFIGFWPEKIEILNKNGVAAHVQFQNE